MAGGCGVGAFCSFCGKCGRSVGSILVEIEAPVVLPPGVANISESKEARQESTDEALAEERVEDSK